MALVDAGDFGGATSGASARLVHGGLRYLGTGGFRLVRTALRERDVLASRVAPHLVRPLPFVLSVPQEDAALEVCGRVARLRSARRVPGGRFPASSPRRRRHFSYRPYV